MAKKDNKIVYLCSSCGDDFPKWVGKCPSCGAWNTLKEYTVRPESTKNRAVTDLLDRRPIPLNEVSGEEAPRVDMLDGELNRVLGGGLVKGSLVLIGGEPGIGKSTLVLQSVVRHNSLNTLYVSGEESPGQIKLRADRLIDTEQCNQCKLFSETDLDLIIQTAINEQPDLLVIDSIQTMQTASADSSAGSLTQVKECTSALLAFAKEYNIPILIIGHITKDGNLAGPKIMEHLVDTVLRFEGDQNHQYRILRSLKNRFGNTSEIGIYEMRSEGLREVSNPSELLLTGSDDTLSGVCIAATIEGVRPLLIEVQALVSSAIYGTPQRSATGADIRRMNMLLAVLEKRAGFKLIQKDVFLNIAGGLRISDPALDLSILASVLSSNLDLPIPRHVCVTGEVGLSGEVRAVSRIDQRISEAKKIGFSTIVIPKDNTKGMDFSGVSIRVVPVSRVDEAFRFLFKEA